MQDLIEHILKAQKQAFIEKIKANTIIIDEDVAKINGFYYPQSHSITVVPTTILGLKVEYQKNLSAEFGTAINFAIAGIKEPKERTSLSEYTLDELLEEIRRRDNDK